MRATFVLALLGCAFVAAEMPTANDVTVEEAGEPMAEDLEPKQEFRKENGILVEYIDGVRKEDQSLVESRRHKMKWAEGHVRTYNRSLVAGEHPGKAFAESIVVFDVMHQKQVDFLEALTEFYTRLVPEKVSQIHSIAKTFEGEEAKLFDALEAKYGERPNFDVTTLHYDFSHHKQYRFESDEVKFWYDLACLDLDIVRQLHTNTVELLADRDAVHDYEALIAELHAADDEGSIHREAMTYALANNQKKLELIRKVSHSAYKYYQVAVELLVERRSLQEQLDEARHKVDEAALANSTEGKAGIPADDSKSEGTSMDDAPTSDGAQAGKEL